MTDEELRAILLAEVERLRFGMAERLRFGIPESAKPGDASWCLHAVKQGIIGEREACAKVAEALPWKEGWAFAPEPTVVGEKIACAIRSRSG